MNFYVEINNVRHELGAFDSSIKAKKAAELFINNLDIDRALIVEYSMFVTVSKFVNHHWVDEEKYDDTH